MNETRYVMSEVVIENVEEVAVKKFKKSSVLLAFALFILIAAFAVMINIGGLIVFDFLFFFGLAMYGKISGKLETDNSKSSHYRSRSDDNSASSCRSGSDNSSIFDDRYSSSSSFSSSSFDSCHSFSSNMSSIPNFGSPGYDSLGSYTGSSTAIGGCSD